VIGSARRGNHPLPPSPGSQPTPQASESRLPRSTWVVLRPTRLPFSVRLDRRVPLVVVLLLVGLLVTLVTSTSYGEYAIAPLDVLRALFGVETSDPNHALVVRIFRLPRILVALLVGAALALSGAILQGITRNDLADPGILGINAGAGVVAVWYLTQAANPAIQSLPWLAFGGALLAAFTIYVLAWRDGSSPLRLILIGIGIGALGNALISFWIIRSSIFQAQQAMIWMAGSVYGSNWQEVQTMLLWLAVLLPLTLLAARHLNTLSLGDSVAAALGMRVEWQRGWLIVFSAALAAISVSMAGTIGFVGFVAPHIARRLVGPSHEGLLFISALVGGLLLLLSDLVARWVISPSELPVGIVTAILGAPYFAYLLYRHGR
jgi:iron complex transport system permease protein